MPDEAAIAGHWGNLDPLYNRAKLVPEGARGFYDGPRLLEVYGSQRHAEFGQLVLYARAHLRVPDANGHTVPRLVSVYEHGTVSDQNGVGDAVTPPSYNVSQNNPNLGHISP